MSDKIVRIGGASGFWGDSGVGAPQLVQNGNLDYLVFDYLAEITMSIMARMRAKNPSTGYAVDFVTVAMKQTVQDIARQGIKVISNAGGVNPAACAAALQSIAEDAGVSLKVAYVTGDDLLAHQREWRAKGISEMFSGADMPDHCWSMNAYLGAIPIAKALADGADVVITGRSVDSAVTLGPLMHEFGWGPEDFDLLAQGSLAGHILECGCQATGGLFTDYHLVPGWDNIGYPIAECHADGSFVVSKPENTGGLVCVGGVSEQLLYEIGDPQAYILPDVVCDFTDVKIEQVGDNRVKVSGAKGSAPTDTYKVSATYQDGWRAVAMITIGGWDAVGKAEKTADAILTRTRRMFAERNLGDYTDTLVEVTGAEAMYGPNSRARGAREVVLKIAARHDDRNALDIFAKEIAPAGTSFAQGTTGFGGGRPKVQPVVRLFSFLANKGDVPAKVHMDDQKQQIEIPAGQTFDRSAIPSLGDLATEGASGDTRTVPLLAIAHGRSGDKGMHSNIGIVARKPEYLPLIRSQLTTDAVADHLAHLFDDPDNRKITRFDLPGLYAVNFFLEESLGGGGVVSLRNDNQGKCYAQMLLDMPVEIPADWDVTLPPMTA